jgi:hypothetical protein
MRSQTPEGCRAGAPSPSSSSASGGRGECAMAATGDALCPLGGSIARSIARTSNSSHPAAPHAPSVSRGSVSVPAVRNLHAVLIREARSDQRSRFCIVAGPRQVVLLLYGPAGQPNQQNPYPIGVVLATTVLLRNSVMIVSSCMYSVRGLVSMSRALKL